MKILKTLGFGLIVILFFCQNNCYAAAAPFYMEFHQMHKLIEKEANVLPATDCLGIAQSQLTLIDNYAWENLENCKATSGPTTICTQNYIAQRDYLFSVMEQNLNSCNGVYNAKPSPIVP